MTEHNIFCYSTNYGDTNSFQQKRYRAFNREVGKEKYNQIKSEIESILEGFKIKGNEPWVKAWSRVTKEQWEQLLAIPEAKDFKKGFEYISGVKINLDAAEIIEVNGKKYKLIS